MKLTRILSLLLCVLLIASVFVGCADDNNKEKNPGDTTSSNDESKNEDNNEVDKTPLEQALDKINGYKGTVKPGKDFNILTRDGIDGQFYVEEMSTNNLEMAVYNRNGAFRDLFDIDVTATSAPDADFMNVLGTDVKSDGQYTVAFGHTDNAINFAINSYTYNFLDLEIDYEQSWWDSGTYSFNVSDGVWFMNGSFNYDDDDCTYVLMFNKKLYADKFSGAEKNFYDMVRAGEWTLDTFNNVIQNISADNGDGTWDEKDTYGFVTTWEYGTTFFYAAGLNYVKCEEGKDPYLAFNDTNMGKANDLLDKILNIYYVGNATYWSPGGSEKFGLDAFTDGRALFYGEVVSYIQTCSDKMTQEFGVLPIPKYNKDQEKHITWTHGISSSMTIVNRVTDKEMTAKLIEAFAVLSDQYVRPEYYEKVLKRKAVKDEDSGPMLDLIFQGRTYDIAMYYDDLGLVQAFKTCVNSNSAGFSSKYTAASKRANSQIKSLVKRLNNRK